MIIDNIKAITSNRHTKSQEFILYIPVQNRKDTSMAAGMPNISRRSGNMVLKLQMSRSVKTDPAAT